jgi:hypothetical protein
VRKEGIVEKAATIRRVKKTARRAVRLIRVERRLLAYAAAAGAVGCGALAGSPAGADIIYTPAHSAIPPFTQLFLDLNHDGIDDFELINQGQSGFFYPYMQAKGLQGNGVLGSGILASRLAKSARIGPGSPFNTFGWMGNGLSGGPWIGSFTGYLGFQFDVNGQLHYGWAALTVGFGFGQPGYSEALTGYAYDTIANQAILAGQTSATPEPGTVALLALGFLGLGRWRRGTRKSEFGERAGADLQGLGD